MTSACEKAACWNVALHLLTGMAFVNLRTSMIALGAGISSCEKKAGAFICPLSHSHVRMFLIDSWNAFRPCMPRNNLRPFVDPLHISKQVSP